MSLLGGTHLSAHEIAMLELEGLPATPQGVRIRAEREGWRWIERSGRGGGRAYAVADLPETARRDYNDRWANATPVARRGRPKGSDYWSANPDVADAVEALIAERPLSAAVILKALKCRFASARLPSRRSLSRYIARLEAEKPAVLASFRDPDEYRSKYRVAIGRADASVTRAHQVWEIDTTKADVLVREGRRSILGIIDVYSRRARFLVVPSESAQSVRRMLVTTIQAWAVMPEVLKTDHGSGFINQSISSALPLLGIEHQPCPPGSPEKKPHIERLFGTFTRDRAELLAGYIGHSVAEAQRLRARAKSITGRAVVVPEMSEIELQAVLDAWVDGEYHQRVHGTIGVAPVARFFTPGHTPAAAPDEGRLKLALSALIGTAIVGKRGVQWKRERYWASELAAWVGRPVTLRRDEDDLGAIFVFDEDGRYIATAVNAARSGLSEEAFAASAKRHQATWMTEQRAAIRAKQRKFSIEDARGEILRHDAEQAGKLAYLPTRAEPRSTPLLDTPVSDTSRLPSADAVQKAERLLTQPKRGAVASIEQRIAETDRVLADLAAGRPVDPEALAAARLFASSSEYRADKILRGEFTARGPRAQHLPQLKESRL
ncbi:DDE-type integrase/transposase/recombinase [Sphingomonas cannabina]|uniref:DDE-type integrase/transposase/recombinase n=1 Tax=Sphingomonas cannabina TaxID=2899123 RepID=UPI001F3AD47C|nr:DDE-type integrase/transposase/recombinase [Sphingomonas cannabina]UIJ46917.1 DDE-type integrase/transposase/recombinase [Sphingomonas cannabina]